MIAIFQFVAGMFLACWASHRINIYDDEHGIRPGASVDGYGSNVSCVWPYTQLCWVGVLVAAFAPFTLLIGSQ